jgi:hypothetical protein
MANVYGENLIMPDGKKIWTNDPNYDQYAAQLGLVIPADKGTTSTNQAVKYGDTLTTPTGYKVSYGDGNYDAWAYDLGIPKSGQFVTYNNEGKPVANDIIPGTVAPAGSVVGQSPAASVYTPSAEVYSPSTITTLTNNNLTNNNSTNNNSTNIVSQPTIESGNTQTADQIADQNATVINNIISNSGLSPYAQLLAQTVIDAYPTDQSIDDERILNVFQQLSTQVVDPYWQDLINTEMSDMQRYISQSQASASAAMSRIGSSAASARSSAETSYRSKAMMEELEAKNRVSETRFGLETSGLMRTGRRVAELGEYAIPEQELVEGRIPELNRKIAESSKAQYQSQLSSIGASASASAASARVDLANRVQNYQVAAEQSIKSLKQQQEKAKGSLLTDLITQQNAVDEYSRLLI